MTYVQITKSDNDSSVLWLETETDYIPVRKLTPRSFNAERTIATALYIDIGGQSMYEIHTDLPTKRSYILREYAQVKPAGPAVSLEAN